MRKLLLVFIPCLLLLFCSCRASDTTIINESKIIPDSFVYSLFRIDTITSTDYDDILTTNSIVSINSLSLYLSNYIEPLKDTMAYAEVLENDKTGYIVYYDSNNKLIFSYSYELCKHKIDNLKLDGSIAEQLSVLDSFIDEEGDGCGN